MSDIEKAGKSFLQKPEGKTGLIVGGAALGAAGYAAYVFLPFIILILQNTLYAMFLMGAISLVVFLACDERIRNLAFYGYKSAMRQLTGAFVEIDPIGIMKGYVGDLRKKYDELEKSIAKLDGQIFKTDQLIANNDAQRNHSLKLASQAQGKDSSKQAFVLQARKAGRLEKSNMTLSALSNKMKTMSRILKKMQESASFLIADIEDEVQSRLAEREALKAGYSAYKSAQSIMAGDSKKELFDQAMEHVKDDYAMKIGEIGCAWEVFEGFIQSVDLENGVFEMEALEALEVWEKSTDVTVVAKNPLQLSANTREGSGPHQFTDLFNKKDTTTVNKK